MTREMQKKNHNDIGFGNDTLIEILELHPNEMQLIHALRTRFRFGDVTITVQNGTPQYWKRITELERPFTPK